MRRILLLSFIVLSAGCNNKKEKKIINSIESESKQSNQILHLKSPNKPYWENEESAFFVESYLKEAKQFSSDAEVVKFASEQVKKEGLFIELGVFTENTINFIAALNPHKKIYGFDSFAGLPEDWVRGDNILPRGTFQIKDPNVLSIVLPNVKLIRGWFCDTLPLFSLECDRDKQIAFLHIDSDIYSSAVTAFTIFKDRIKAGTIIVFDELYNYPGYENHEFKAFQEFLKTHNLKAQYLAYNIYHEQVAVLIENPLIKELKQQQKIKRSFDV